MVIEEPEVPEHLQRIVPKKKNIAGHNIDSWEETVGNQGKESQSAHLGAVHREPEVKPYWTHYVPCAYYELCVQSQMLQTGPSST
jgi:hypothetical protein